LQNTGNIGLSIDSINVSNSNFSVANLSKGVSLSPNQKLEFQVWFRPATSGTSSTTVVLSSSSLPAPLKISVSGSATTAPVSSPSTASHSVALEWQPSSSSVAGYHVYRGDSSANSLSRVTNTLISSLSFKDGSVQAGGHYHYVVTAVSSDGTESPFSNEVSADIPTP
jgi:fibronectin type 3 domain-containing protein